MQPLNRYRISENGHSYELTITECLALERDGTIVVALNNSESVCLNYKNVKCTDNEQVVKKFERKVADLIKEARRLGLEFTVKIKPTPVAGDRERRAMSAKVTKKFIDVKGS